MESETAESFHELCARTLKEHDVETVPEIVERILRAIPESETRKAEQGPHRLWCDNQSIGNSTKQPGHTWR
jgi:hypothetical protein